ncbi:putative membrane transporter [Leptomonas pyrrhocoris]|uniref:Putative membrane transporter n=1 Tax=Leptomonas pyrrhocoris TaxID=157538 RepID=A0A0N0DT32_LEPPY|nr:putative membrane transporter [Leptomonas pyrrhocoris]XP_015654919.1 putative membrane transporter [Leptomonas pyrrhocoris]XP_015654920.1 putative membrane transporter [Leptomonas pyrrhocoris]KPA76479.1 putative membrane transporter [Leptomonas pyrrhocoris]KPA76480.1 putative membrane transporter [Leptomonas pyrrhocoris]KPA76481.1 putative membrane transporter [Leptomonas pyrrhocoris]|eukprot:XP_015654918.1 putative membrane transporter [Leptomonas pyrrhocoris]
MTSRSGNNAAQHSSPATTDAATTASPRQPVPATTTPVQDAPSAVAVAGEAVPAVALPASHDELLRTTTEVLSHFYPASPRAASAFAPACVTADCSSSSSSADTAAAAEELIEECGSPLPIAPAPWRYMELPFLSTADQMRTQSGGIASDDADEHTPLLMLVTLLVRLALPVTVTHVLRLSMSFITTVFMGHYLSTEKFAAAATGLTFTTLTAMSIGAGFAYTLDTLATQEHGRRKHSPEIAAIFLRSVVCTFAAYLPIAVFYFFCDPVLALLIHADLVADTAYFLRMSVFIAAPMMLVNSFLKFAQSQRVTQLGVVCSAAGALTLPPLLFLFRNNGLPGIIAALSINRFFTLAVVVVGVLRNAGLRQCWTGRSLPEHIKAVLANGAALWEFTKVGIPVLAANCADSWSFEVLGVAAANLGPTSAAVWSVVMMLYSMLFGGYVGLAAAGAIRIGNSLGQGKGLLARRYSYATALVAACCTLVLATVLWLGGGVIFRYMQSNDEVTRRGESMTALMAATFLFDSIFYACSAREAVASVVIALSSVAASISNITDASLSMFRTRTSLWCHSPQSTEVADILFYEARRSLPLESKTPKRRKSSAGGSPVRKL